MINIRSKSLAKGLRRVPSPALIVDRRRRILSMNGKAGQMSGLAAGEVVGKMTCRQVCRCTLPVQDCPLKQAFETPQIPLRSQIEIAPRGRKTCVIERIHSFKDDETGEERAAIVFLEMPR